MSLVCLSPFCWLDVWTLSAANSLDASSALVLRSETLNVRNSWLSFRWIQGLHAWTHQTCLESCFLSSAKAAERSMANCGRWSLATPDRLEPSRCCKIWLQRLCTCRHMDHCRQLYKAVGIIHPDSVTVLLWSDSCLQLAVVWPVSNTAHSTTTNIFVWQLTTTPTLCMHWERWCFTNNTNLHLHARSCLYLSFEIVESFCSISAFNDLSCSATCSKHIVQLKPSNLTDVDFHLLHPRSGWWCWTWVAWWKLSSLLKPDRRGRAGDESHFGPVARLKARGGGLSLGDARWALTRLYQTSSIDLWKRTARRETGVARRRTRRHPAVSLPVAIETITWSWLAQNGGRLVLRSTLTFLVNSDRVLLFQKMKRE